MRKPPISPNEYYHIYNRGASKGKIFFIPEHWRLFLRQLKKYFQHDFGDIISYCLMPNHFHLMVSVNCENFGNKVMMPLTVSYTKLVNRQMNRTGHLFQGPYQAKHIKSTAQLLQLSRYIHLNPVKAGFVTNPEEWWFSSYRDYIGLRDGTLTWKDIVLSGFLNAAEYRKYVETVQENETLDSITFNET